MGGIERRELMKQPRQAGLLCQSAAVPRICWPRTKPVHKEHRPRRTGRRAPEARAVRVRYEVRLEPLHSGDRRRPAL